MKIHEEREHKFQVSHVVKHASARCDHIDFDGNINFLMVKKSQILKEVRTLFTLNMSIQTL